MYYDGKVVLVSGATGGMGEEIVKKLAKYNCKIAIFARRVEKLKKMAEELSSKNSEIIYKKCDVTNKKDVEEAVKYTKEKFNRIDIAILNAGVLVPNPIEKMESSVVVKSMEINFFGTLYFLEQLFPIMKKQKESTISVTSTLPDRRGLAGWGAYGASKAAISWFMESLRPEAKQKYNINILTVKPGSVETPMIADYHRPGALTSEKAAEIILKGIRRKRKVIQFPFSQVFMTRAGDLFPNIVYDAIPIYMQKGDKYPEPEEK